MTTKKVKLLIEVLADELDTPVRELATVLEEAGLIDIEEGPYWGEVEKVTEGTSDVMIKLPDFKETGKHFRCSCGGNVFRKRSDGKYRCNSCSELYTSNESEAASE